MTETPKTPLPGGWHGRDLAAHPELWVRRWTDGDLAAFEDAVAAVGARGHGWEDLAGPEDFPLPAPVRARLAEVAGVLEDGAGLVRIEGLPVEGYAPAQLKCLWMGLGHHLGTPVFQDSHGQMMREIRDEGGDLAARHGAIEGAGQDGGTFLSSKARTYSNGVLRFHTDRTDVVGLLTAGQAASGGRSKVASTIAVHNEILARRPHLLAELYRPYWRSRLGEEDGGAQAVYALPVFGLRDGRLTSHYSRTYIEAAELTPGTPPMTEAQRAAIDLLAEVAEELCYRMTLAPGDIQLLNSHVTYHARDAFQDAPGSVRCLYRLWLSMPNSRALPEDHRVLWRDVEAGARRGGIGQDGVPA